MAISDKAASAINSNVTIDFSEAGFITIAGDTAAGECSHRIDLEDLFERLSDKPRDGFQEWEEVFLRLAAKCNSAHP